MKIEFGVRAFLDLGLDFPSVSKMARASELAGYSSFWVNDVLMSRGRPVLESWTTLSALSTITHSIVLGPLVLCNSYRHPPILAKMTATLDQISHGRVRLGIGIGGWGGEEQHRVFGLEYPAPYVRLLRLRESINLMRELWKGKPVNFKGKFFELKGATCSPGPIEGRIPIWIGGSGKLLIRFAAELADVWDTGFCTMDEYRRMVDSLEATCDRLGSKASSIGRSVWFQVVAAPTKALFDRKMRNLRNKLLYQKGASSSSWIRDMEPGEYLDRRLVSGTYEDAVEKISDYIESGADHFILSFLSDEPAKELKQFASNVIPKL